MPFLNRNYNQQQNDQNIEAIVLQLASFFDSSKNFPTHMYGAIQTIFNDQLQVDSIKLLATQMNINRWAENLMNIVMQMPNFKPMKNSGSVLRVKRNNVEESQEYEQELKEIFTTLNIKPRLSNLFKSEQPTVGIICLRVGDVDKVCFY